MQTTPTAQIPSIHRKKIGDIVVTAILDGMLVGSFDLVNGITPDEAAKVMEAGFRPGKPILTINCFVVNTGGKVVLIDSGGGANEMFEAGRLPQALNAAGVSPDMVDLVLMSHLHPDHTGGLATKDGRAIFHNAELMVHADEVKFWLETENPPAGMKPYFDSAKAAVAPYKDRMRTFTGGELAAGITAEPLPGHTPGHCGFHIASGAESLMMWTDIVHMPVLQTRHPEVTMAFDADPEQAKSQRRRLFDKVASEKMLVAGSHLDFPAFAHLERSGDGYAFVADVWRPSL